MFNLDYYLHQIDISDDTRKELVRGYETDYAVKYIIEDEDDFEQFMKSDIKICSAHIKKPYKGMPSVYETLLSIKRKEEDIIDSFVGDIARVHLSKPLSYYEENWKIEYDESRKRELENVSDEALAISNIVLYMHLSYGILTAVNRAITTIDIICSDTIPLSKTYFHKMKYTHLHQLVALRDILISKGYISEYTWLQDFIYYFSGRGDTVPKKRLVWLKNKESLVTFILAYSSVEDSPEWAVAENVFEGVKASSLKAIKTRLMNTDASFSDRVKDFQKEIIEPLKKVEVGYSAKYPTEP